MLGVHLLTIVNWNFTVSVLTIFTLIFGEGEGVRNLAGDFLLGFMYQINRTFFMTLIYTILSKEIP